MGRVAMRAPSRICWLACLLFSISLGACTGDTGEQGPEGPEGPQGPPGEGPDIGIEREPLGLVGRVIEPNLLQVSNGTVYLVPAVDVEALSQTPIDLFATPEETALLDNDEPIEDLIDAHSGSYERAAVENGEYRFETLPEGSHFVVWFPAADDDRHLPGGNNTRVAFPTASLVGMQMDIFVSSQPSPEATYVGSSTCMACHGLHSTTATAHNVGLQVPGVRSALQDISPWPNFDEGLDAFDPPTTLYYYDCDGAALDSSQCQVRDSPPAGTVSCGCWSASNWGPSTAGSVPSIEISRG